MTKARVGFALLAFLLPLLLNAAHFLKNDLLNNKASQIIEEIGNELQAKTGINAYVIATNEHFPERYNLVAYSRNYESNMSKPYVLLIFAPHAIITEASKQQGRIGLIASSQELSKLYDSDAVKDSAIDVVSKNDSNSDKDKYAIGVVQSFSELADQIAASKNVEMIKTLPNDTRVVVGIMQYLVFFGTIIVAWIYFIRPLYMRIKNGNK